MRKIILIGWKDVTLAFRDRAALILMLAAPFALTLGLGFVTGRFSGSGSIGVGDIPIVLVNQDRGQLGDALVEVPGMKQRVAPSSTVTGAAMLNTVVASSVELIHEGSGDAPVFMSANLDGGDEYNRRWLEHYHGRLTYL